MLLRGYLDQPPQLAPDPGEIVYARRASDDAFTLGIVEKVWRNRAGHIRVRLVWLGENRNASPGETDRNDRDGMAKTIKRTTLTRAITPGETGWITMRQQLGESPLLKQVDKRDLPADVREILTHGTSAPVPDSSHESSPS